MMMMMMKTIAYEAFRCVIWFTIFLRTSF